MLKPTAETDQENNQEKKYNEQKASAKITHIKKERSVLNFRNMEIEV